MSSLPLTKILIGGLLVTVIFASFFFYKFFNSGQTENTTLTSPDRSISQISAGPSPVPDFSAPATPSGSFANVASPLPSPSAGATPTSSQIASLQNEINTLEQTVATLQNRVATLESSGQTATQTTTTSSKVPVYIPLGSGGSASGLDWTTQDSLAITLDPGSYSGYTSMQLEVSLSVYQGNGTAYTRLYNSDDGTGVTNSDVSTTSQSYNWVTSNGFSLPSGSKTYKIQLKTSTGYAAQVQDARIKVNF